LKEVEPLFLGGEYDIFVDEKNRFSVPADLRHAIDSDEFGDKLIVKIGANRKPWLYPDKYYRRLLSRFTPQAVPPEELLMYDHFNISMTFTVPMDKQGRVTLPDKIVRRTGVTGDVTLTGTRDHMELWPRAEWEAYYELLKANPGDVASRAQLAMSQAAINPAAMASQGLRAPAGAIAAAPSPGMPPSPQ
jgi:MraZ protein